MKRIKKKLKKLVNIVTASAFMTCAQISTVMAATDTSSVTKPLDSLKTLLLSVIGAVGVIILALINAELKNTNHARGYA